MSKIVTFFMENLWVDITAVPVYHRGALVRPNLGDFCQLVIPSENRNKYSNLNDIDKVVFWQLHRMDEMDALLS